MIPERVGPWAHGSTTLNVLQFWSSELDFLGSAKGNIPFGGMSFICQGETLLKDLCAMLDMRTAN